VISFIKFQSKVLSLCEKAELLTFGEV